MEAFKVGASCPLCVLFLPSSIWQCVRPSAAWFSGADKWSEGLRLQQEALCLHFCVGICTTGCQATHSLPLGEVPPIHLSTNQQPLEPSQDAKEALRGTDIPGRGPLNCAAICTFLPSWLLGSSRSCLLGAHGPRRQPEWQNWGREGGGRVVPHPDRRSSGAS